MGNPVDFFGHGDADRVSEDDGGKGVIRLRDFRIVRKDDEGEKEMNRLDVNFGVERNSSGKARRRKGKGKERKW